MELCGSAAQPAGHLVAEFACCGLVMKVNILQNLNKATIFDIVYIGA
jgi:hypothetical protein